MAFSYKKMSNNLKLASIREENNLYRILTDQKVNYPRALETKFPALCYHKDLVKLSVSLQIIIISWDPVRWII